MAETYLPIEFTYRINLEPAHLNKNLHETIKKRVQKELNNVCLPAHGHIKPGTVRIISKTLGRIAGSHLTGNVTYDVLVQCQATKPIKGHKIVCTIIEKNEAGIMARNFVMPFIFFIPRTDETSPILDSLQIDSTIEVIMRDYKLIPPNKDQTMAEYLIIADISATNIDSSRLTGLQHIADMTTVDWTVTTMAPGTVVDGSTDLTDRWYNTLMDTKRLISQINSEYNRNLSTSATDFLLDTKIANLQKRGQAMHVVGELIEAQRTGDMVHHVFNVVRAFPGYNYEVGQTYELDLISKYNMYPGDIVIYTIDDRRLNAWAYDFWSGHVRAVINEYELVHPSLDYISQIKAIDPDFTLQSDEKISRAYYKMWEIIRNESFNKVLVSAEPLRILNLAEAPGGFVQALIDFRKNFNVADDIVAVSINPNDGGKTWPEFGLVKNVRNLVNVAVSEPDYRQISTGYTSNLHLLDGDLYEKDVRDRLYSGDEHHVGYSTQKADFITGDGGMRSERDEDQELVNQRLLFSQAVTAMMCQKEGGTFVLKCFDIAHEFTANIVAILCAMYTDVNIYKPKGSRPANSEKYLVCHGYKPNDEVLDKVIAILNNWPADSKIDQLFKTPPDLRIALQHFNALYMSQQIAFIESGLEYSKTYLQSMGNAEVMGGKVSIQKARRTTFFG